MSILNAGKIAPAFELTTMDGGRLSLQQALANGPILLTFFKVSCPTCQFTFPFLQRMYSQLSTRKVQIWGIVQDDPQDAKEFAKAFGINFPILIDEPPYKISRSYGLTHVPSLFLVNADGSIESSVEGFAKADLEGIQRTLAQRLSATPPALFLPTEKIPQYKPG
jgi:peroxiredoxin